MTLPNFFVIGAARCGTTSLHYYLAQHPDICMSTIKEPNFFLFDRLGDGHPFVADERIIAKSISSQQAYQRLFPAQTESAVGEASPLYIYAEPTPNLIATIVPEARVVAVLRDPVERAWSHFRYVTGVSRAAAAPFLDRIKTELPLPDEPYRTGTHYLRLGRYARQLRRYLEAFDRSRIMPIDYSRLVETPRAVLAELCGFLGIEDGFRFDTDVRWNPGSVTAGGRLDRLIAPALPRLKRTLPGGVVGAAARFRARRRAEHRDIHVPPPEEAYSLTTDYFADDRMWVRERFGLDLA